MISHELMKVKEQHVGAGFPGINLFDVEMASKALEVEADTGQLVYLVVGEHGCAPGLRERTIAGLYRDSDVERAFEGAMFGTSIYDWNRMKEFGLELYVSQHIDVIGKTQFWLPDLDALTRCEVPLVVRRLSEPKPVSAWALLVPGRNKCLAKVSENGVSWNRHVGTDPAEIVVAVMFAGYGEQKYSPIVVETPDGHDLSWMFD